MKYRLIKIYFAFFIFVTIRVCAQENLKFEHYNNINNFSINSIGNILEDSDGFIWFSTNYENNIICFDSYQFTEYNIGAGANLYFEDTINNEKVLIISIKDRLHTFNLIDYKIKALTTNEGKALYVNDVLKDKYGNYRIKTGKWLYNYNPLTKKASDSTQVQYLYNMFQFKETLWATEYGIIKKFDVQNKPIKSYGKWINVSDFFLSPNSELCFIDGNGAIYILNTELDTFEAYNINSIADHITLHQVIAGQGSQYFIISNKGLYTYNYKLKELNLYSEDEYNPFSIESNSINAIHLSKDNVLWLGYYQFGLSKCNLLANDFQVIKKQNLKNGLQKNIINNITQDKDGNYWIASNGVAITRYIPEKNIYQYIPSFNSNEAKATISNMYNIYVEDENTIWCSSYNFGVHKIDISKIRNYFEPGDISNMVDIQGHFPVDETPEESIVGWSFRDIYVDKEGVVWAASLEGLSKYKNNKWSNYFSKFYPEWQKKPVKPIAIFDDIDGIENILLIGVDNEGLYYLKKNTGECGQVEFATELVKIEQIEKTGDGNYWLLTNDLYKVSIDKVNMTGKVVDVYKLNDIETNRMAIDTKGIIWIASENGLIRIDTTTKKQTKFGIKDGLPTEGLASCYFNQKQNSMYLASNKGIIKYEPDKIRIPALDYPVKFISFKRFGKTVNPRDTVDGQILLSRNLNYLDEIVLRHTDNDFTLEFAALAYNGNHNIRYAYMLKGYDKEWRYCIPPNREASYSNLPANNYKFIVCILDSSGNPTENKIAINIKILPAWWATWWFRFLIAILVIASIFLIWQLRIKSLKKRQRELEIQVLERTEEIRAQSDQLVKTNLLLQDQKDEIEAQSENLKATMLELEKSNATKDKFFSIIAHDLKNPFNAISGFAALFQKKYKQLTDDKKLEFIAFIEASSNSAFDLLENLLTWSRSQTNNIEFNPEPFPIQKVIDQTLKLLKATAQNKNISLTCDNKDTNKAFADINMITTVVRNIINNAIKFTPENGNITVNTQPINNKLCISIIDTGVGMTSEKLDKLFNITGQNSTLGTSGESGTGLGLVICKEFIDKNSGKIEVESEVGKGSTFKIFLPIAK